MVRYLSLLFRVSLRRRLRVPIWSQDSNCSLCGQVLDRWRDHTLACGFSCHNLIRDVVHSAASDRANLAAVLEKPGLLIPVTPLMMIAPPHPVPPDLVASRRRADVWVPRGLVGDKRLGTSPSPAPLNWAQPSPNPRLLLAFLLRLSLGRTLSSTQPHSAPRQASLSVI